MKNINAIASVAGVLLVGLGVAMVVTNPSPEAYNEYATERLTEFAKERGCEQVPIGQGQCRSLIQSAQPQIQELIRQKTQRQNFLFWSLYKTDLSLPLGLLPSYEFETVGAFESFYTYEYNKH